MRRILFLLLLLSWTAAAPAGEFLSFGTNGGLGGTIAGSPTFTGNSFFTSVNGTKYCDQFPGATADAKINACIAALPSQGGIADATGLTGAQTIAATITVPSKVTLRLAGQSVWTCTIVNAAQSCILMNGSFADLVCEGNASNLCQIALGASASVKDILEMNPGASGLLALMNVRGIEVNNFAGGAVANAAAELIALSDCAFYNFTVDYFSGRGLWIHDGTAAGQLINSISFFNIYLNGNHIAGAKPLVIESLNGNSVGSIHFYGNDWGHPGAGQFAIALNGHKTGGGAGVFHVDFNGIYMESNSTDTSTALMSATDVLDLGLNNVFFNRLSVNSTAAALAIAESAAGNTIGVTATNFRIGGGSNCTGTITNSVPGLPSGTQNGCTLNHYDFISSEDANSAAMLGPVRLSGTSITVPIIVYNTIPAATNSTIGSTAMVTPSSNATYRFNYYWDQTALGSGCTGATNISASLTWTDPAASSFTSQSTTSFSISGNGTVGNVQAPPNSPSYVIRVKSATTVSYATSYTLGTGCSTGPSYQFFPVLEQIN